MNFPAGTQALCTLRFEGRRFEQHRFDVECTAELMAYRKLVLECAKELWHRARPDRVRLPRGFEDGFRLAFDRVKEGSAALPLMRVYESPDPVQYELLDDTFYQAAALIEEAVAAAGAEDLLPSALPANVVPLFGEFGRTLREDEVLYLRTRGRPVEARYSAMARQRLENWVEASYEDKVDVVGEVQMAHVGPGRFSLLVPDTGQAIDGRFDERQESVVLDALRAHREDRMRVRGVAEFSSRDRQMRRSTRVDQVEIAPIGSAEFDASAVPIWEQLAAIGAAEPSAWEGVPDDLSKRIDEVVYGAGAAER
jgi:hypothetical protein